METPAVMISKVNDKLTDILLRIRVIEEKLGIEQKKIEINMPIEPIDVNPYKISSNGKKKGKNKKINVKSVLESAKSMIDEQGNIEEE